MPGIAMSETILGPAKESGGTQAKTAAGDAAARKEGIGAFSGVGTEPLARLSDIDEFRAGYAKLKSGEWDAGKWQGYRLGCLSR